MKLISLNVTYGYNYRYCHLFSENRCIKQQLRRKLSCTLFDDDGDDDADDDDVLCVWCSEML